MFINRLTDPGRDNKIIRRIRWNPREFLASLIQAAFALKNARLACAGRGRIRRNLKRAIESGPGVIKAAQINVKFSTDTTEQLEVPRIQLERFLEGRLGFLPKTNSALNEGQILQQVGIIRQSCLRLLVPGYCAREVA